MGYHPQRRTRGNHHQPTFEGARRPGSSVFSTDFLGKCGKSSQHGCDAHGFLDKNLCLGCVKTPVERLMITTNL